MTFHFAHMAPPGAPCRIDRVTNAPALRPGHWPLPRRPVMHWDRSGDDPAIPAQPVPAARPLTGARAA